jgi:thymidylate synthase
MTQGTSSHNRTNINVKRLFGYHMRLPLIPFPLITTKYIHFKSVVGELLWFLSGSTNVKPLQQQGIRIWNEWADEQGELGPTYGQQWRAWDGKVDQIAQVIDQIRTHPTSRRLLVSAWNVTMIPHMRLPPCHVLFQFFVDNDRLSCHVYQRSADVFLGVPFNLASYALLTHLIAAQTHLIPHELIWTGGDCHIYDNHLEVAAIQLLRQPFPLPTLTLAPRLNINDYTPSDITLNHYQHHPPLKATVAV